MVSNIYILTGFLGSGKTTLLKKLIDEANQNHESNVVLMNEVGEISIDTALIKNQTKVNEILNGCICCSNREQFEQTLMATIQNEHPETIFIECSGISHPYEVIDSCLNPIMSDQINIKGTIVVLDTKHFLHRDEEAPAIARLMLEQVLHSDLIVLTKEDLLTPDEHMQLMDTLDYLDVKSKIYRPQKFNSVREQLAYHKNIKKHEHLDVHHHLHIDTITYTFDHAITQHQFEKWLMQLPDNILRVKGFIDFSDRSEACTLVQYASGVPLFQPYEMNLKKNLVIIGQNLDKHSIMTQLKNLK